ncbi:MAG TPA: amino acid adenylation domain-containing protein [Thermoanaerobaculia bacterium]
MSLTDRISALTPEQRALFEKLREKQRQAAAPKAPPPIRRVTGPTAEGDWPLSLDQERYWFMEQLFPQGAGLNVTAATRMRGPLAPELVETALDEITRRHAAWRTVFPAVDGRPVQRVLPARRQLLQRVDLSALPPARREAEALRLVGEDSALPFDLERGPLVRSRLLRLDAGEHVCLLTIHHLVTDFISSHLAWTELAVLYNALAAGSRPALPEPAVQYPDFAVWQREWLQGETLEELSSWWRERLEGFPRALDLPADRPRPAELRMRGGRLTFQIDAGLADGRRALARQEGATLFMVVLALTAAGLHRDSGEEKLVLGANNANRNRPEIQTVLGCFLTQVPFPLDLGGEPTFRELLGRARQSALGAYAHQDLPFGQLVQAIRLERDASRPPLVQTLVQVLDGQPASTTLAGASFEVVDAWDGRARYDLMLTLFEIPGGALEGALEYDADLFDPATSARRIERLLLQAAAVVADPDLPLRALPVLPEAARHQALAEWNDTARPAAGWTAPRRFAERAAAAPEAPAVLAGGEALTYGELDRRSTALARRLRALGVEPEARVALLLGRTADVPVAVLGVWKAGGAYVPLDLGSPAERLADLLADCEPAVVVHRGPLPVALAEGTPALDLAVDGSGEGDGPLPEVRPEHLAYLIYTSGTTGRPKAVMATHQGLSTTLQSVIDLLAMGPGDRVPHLSRYTFDASLLELVAPLVTGGVVEIVERDEILDLERLLAILARSTVAFTVPALLRRAAAGAREQGPVPFAGLRGMSIGGDVVPPDLQAEVLAAFPATDVHVVYGPTETTIICTSQRLSRRRPLDRALIGRPLPEVEARVVDARGEPVPPGIPGELWIGGPGVARGYFRREELTAGRFVEVDGRRFYRTGDLARQVPAEGGALEFLGRTDLQVKIRGFRVEPGEVEAALLAHPAVRDTVVVARPGAGGESQLVAYVVGGEGEDLRAFLRARLPEHMVPALLVPLEVLPVGPTGKVDRKALPAPRPAARDTAGPALPRDAREERLAEIWRGVLGLDQVGIHDNFFELGGDSILGIQVVARARQAGLLLTPRQLFEHQTIAGLAAVAGGVEGPGDDQGPVTGEAPLTPIQRQFFAEERQRPAHFNQAVVLVPRERLDAARLAAALDRLAAHHDALRLRFIDQKQIHAPAAAVPLLERDLTAAPSSLVEEMEILQDGLDLAEGPLFTAALFRLGEEDRLLLTAHHLVVDGVSWRVLLEDLAAAYRGRELPPKTTSWKRWAGLLADHAHSPEVEAEMPYWRSLPVPPPLPRDLDGSSGAATLSIELGAGETRALLQEAPEAYRTQANDLLLAALARAFAAWTGERALRVGLEGHGREEIAPGIDLSRTVGWFTTLYPVVLALPPGGPGEAIRAVKETLRSVPGRGLGYGLLRDRLPADPAPEVTFNYLGRFDHAGESGLFAFAPEAPRNALGEPVAGRPCFQIDALVLDDRLRVSWTYDPGRHLPATVQRLAEGFLAELVVLAEHCLSPEAGGFTPSDFPLAGLDQGTLDRLVGTDRGVEDLYPLAPMQEGMLFHSLYAGGADVYFEQFTAEIEGNLDEEAFAAAWRRVVERHTALRTAFVWHGVERPLQLVRKSVEIPWASEDWRGLPAAEADARWRAFLAADHARGFDLARAPLLRLALARVGEARRRLAWSTHHILFDGWCFPLLLNEVFTLYGAAVKGRPAELPPARPFRDYIDWLGRRDPAEAEAFWRQRLEGFTAPTPVPFDRPDRLPPGHVPGPEEYFDRAVTLPAALGASLEGLAQRLRVTLNTLVQGAWALLLARYGETADITFGAVVSGRPAELPGVESMVGLFINTVPVRVEVPEDGSAAAWLARLQADQAELRQHEWTPLALLQKLAGLAAGESLFATLLVFENYPMDPALAGRLGDLRITGAGLAERTNYPFTLTVTGQGGIGLRLTADPRCEPATAVRMLGHLEALLANLAADPEAPPAGRPLLSTAERHQLTAEWNDTAPAQSLAATIPALFAAQAARAPEAVAVVCGDEEITYAELGRRAREVAGRLLQAGLPPETRVAVPAVRSLDLIPTLLGILQAGCAYLPVDPELPEERRRFLLEDAGAVFLDDVPVPAVPAVPEVPVPAVFPDQLAYVIYTSGSTGTPKGVAVTHANVASRMTRADYVALGPGETLLQAVNVAFDVSTLEIWGPLLNGGRLAVLPGRRLDLAELEAAVRRHGATTLWLTAGLFHQMIDERPRGLRPVRQLLAGGDALSPAHVRRALAELPGCALINGYGPTENTVFTTTHRMTAADLADGRLAATVPIGRPLPATTVHVLDSSLRPVPAGVWGELCTGGDGVARGYLGRPDLTAERFVPDPWGDGSRLYRTGDVVRRRPDGVIEFLGRRDGQVKIRGIRIELGEIEAALARHPAVRASVVVPWEAAGDRRLAAYVAGDATEGELRRHLAALLPEAMIPAAFVILDRLPLTVTGKVDRRALPSPDPAAGRAKEYQPPSNPVEESLAAACAELLGRERVGVRDNFFDLGGHSLLATRLVTRLRDRHGIDVSLQTVFDAADLRDLADRVIGQALEEEAGDLSEEELQALLAGEPPASDGAV